jgi:hypothetical protein
VLESPDGGFVQNPSPKVLPDGYALAPDVTVGIDDTCVSPATTTTTVTTSTTDTTTTTTNSTTTTTLVAYTLTLSRVHAKAEKSAGAANGSVDAKGEFATPPGFSSPPSFSVRVQDSETLDVSHTFETCTTKPNGKIACRESGSGEDNRATFTPRGDMVGFHLSMRGRSISAPLAGPVSITLLHNSAIVRTDSIDQCTSTASSLQCKE